MIDALTGTQLTHIRAKTARMVFLVELETEDEVIYLSSAARDIEWNGKTWVGRGAIAVIEPIEEKIGLEAVAVKLGVTGVPLEWRSLALQENLRGKECSVHVGFLDDNEQMIDTPITEYRGRIDTPTIQTTAPDEDGNRTATISITVEGVLVTWARGGRGRRHTHEDQQHYYPGDKGYEYADAVSNETVLWGVPY